MPDLPSWNPNTEPYPYTEGTNQTDWQGGSSSQAGYANAYDPRIGNSPLPPGITGSANRAYVGYTQPDQTAESHLNNMLNSDSAYMQNARTRGLELANKRGLLNSSIAAGNSQRSAIESASPIAMQDANTFAQQARQNVQVLNDREIANLQRRAAGGGSNAASARMQLEGQMQLQRERLAYEGEQAELQRQYGSYNQNQGYGQALGLQNNQYGNMLNNQLRTDSFGAGIASGLSSQNYYQQASLAGMNNPAIINNPQGFQNYLGYMQGGFQNSINDLLGYALGGY